MSSSLRRTLALVATLVLLAGCNGDRINNCPSVSSLVETSIATVFRPGTTPDPSNILYTIEIMGVSSSCGVDKKALTADTGLDISFRATRAPSGNAAEYKVPYFVAVTQSDRIIAKKLFTVTFSFEPGQTTTTFTDPIASAAVTAGREKKTYEYEVLVGLQLTKAQLEFNRTSGRLTP